MTPVLSTTAWVLHDLGVATDIGGAIFERIAMRPAVRRISSEAERSEVIATAWKSFSAVKSIGMGMALSGWIIGRSMLSGRSIDANARNLVYVKDGLAGLALMTGMGAMFTGMMAMRRDEHAPAVVAGDAAHVHPRAAQMMRLSDMLGGIGLAAVVGMMGVTTVLAMKAGTSHKWGVVSRMLP